MNRITSFLALSAIVVAGAFAGTAARASANVVVDFKVYDGDATASMIRTSSLGSAFSGLIDPAAAISPGGYDPSSGFGQLSLPTPSVGHEAHGSVAYANASDGISNLCTFTISVTRTSQTAFGLHFSVVNNSANCTVPGNDTSSTGQFTATAYQLTWSR